MTEDKEIVLGYSRYKRKNSFLNLFIRWETFYSAMQYFSYSIIGKTYMGVGRNLAYRKSLFFKVKGFYPSVITDPINTITIGNFAPLLIV